MVSIVPHVQRSSMVTIISRQVNVFPFLLPLDLWLRSSLRAVKLYWKSQSHISYIWYLLQYLVSVKSSPRTSVSAGPRCTDGTNSPTLRISAPRSGRELRKLITMDQDQCCKTIHRFHNRFSQSWRRPLLGWKHLLALSHLRHYAKLALTPR